MANYFVDFEGGNDANDGTTFANRKKTIGSLGTTPAAGDTIRIMGSPADTALGNCDFTQGNSSVTIPSGIVKVLNQCEATTGWTAAANNTQTTTTTRRQGSNALSWALAAGFTTGKLSTLDLGSDQDLSSWQQVCFWIRASVATIVAADLTLKMYSDASGTVEVGSINFVHPIAVANNWYPVVLDNGSALPTNVRSIALVANNDFGAATILIDGIFVSKAPSAADCLTLHSLVRRDASREYWHAIQSVTDTTMVLDCDVNVNAGSERGYPGATGSAQATRVRQPIVITPLTTGSFVSMAEPGVVGNHMVWSGGWNRTDMSTRTLETFVTGSNGVGIGWNFNGHDYHDLDRVSMVRFSDGIVPSGNFNKCTNVNGISCTNGYDAGSSGSHGQITIEDGSCVGSGSQGYTGPTSGGCTFRRFDSVTGRDVGFRGGQFDKYYDCKALYNSTYALNITAPHNELHDFESRGQGTGSVFFSQGGGDVRLHRSTLNESVEAAWTSAAHEGVIYSQDHDGVYGAAKQIGRGWNAYNINNGHAEAADRRTTGAGKECWKIAITNTERDAEYQVYFSLTPKKIRCLADVAVTFTAYVKKSTASAIQAVMVLKGGSVAGIAADVTDTKADDTSYEQLSITFTPTEDAMVEVFLKVWVTSGTTHGVFVDDLGIS